MSEPTLYDEMLNELQFFERYLSGEECSCDSRDGRYHAPRCASWSLLRNVRNLIARAGKRAGTIGAQSNPEPSDASATSGDRS